VTEEQPVGVLVVDDQRLIRDGIASLLGLQPGIAVVGTAANGREAVERAVTLAADVVLMDVRMPEVDGIAALELLRRRAPACRVVMLTTFDDGSTSCPPCAPAPRATCSKISPPGNWPARCGWRTPAWASSIRLPRPASWRRSRSPL
jgi:DNA-binding NarL/FixJ family response regulator